EANQRSGSLITARLAAADYGREVFAIPGRIDSPASSGVHHLIKSGAAHLVEGLDDILSALGDTGTALARAQQKAAALAAKPAAAQSGDLFAAGPATPKSPAATKPATLDLERFTKVQQKILVALENDRGDGLAVDDLCGSTDLPASVVMAELTMLQIRAAVSRAAGNRFVRSH
ncbi:MAG: DNA-processing protein DprA, partial [Phycisphaerae bacterium]